MSFLNLKFVNHDVISVLKCRRNEKQHVKSNLVHKLFRVKKVGRQPLEYFKDMITPDEYKASELKQSGKNWTWYSLTQDALNGVLNQVNS